MIFDQHGGSLLSSAATAPLCPPLRKCSCQSWGTWRGVRCSVTAARRPLEDVACCPRMPSADHHSGLACRPLNPQSTARTCHVCMTHRRGRLVCSTALRDMRLGSVRLSAARLLSLETCAAVTALPSLFAAGRNCFVQRDPYDAGCHRSCRTPHIGGPCTAHCLP